MLTGHVGDDEVMLARQGGKLFAVSAHCTHYHGPLAEGLLVGETVRCPWHHARFSLQTGEAVAAPALSPLTCWQIEERDGTIVVKNKKAAVRAKDRAWRAGASSSSAEAPPVLRRRRFCGAVASTAVSSMLSNDTAAPVDRPNLSKDYLAGSAPEDWVPLRGDDWYAENKIDLNLKTEVTARRCKIAKSCC